MQQVCSKCAARVTMALARRGQLAHPERTWAQLGTMALHLVISSCTADVHARTHPRNCQKQTTLVDTGCSVRYTAMYFSKYRMVHFAHFTAKPGRQRRIFCGRQYGRYRALLVQYPRKSNVSTGSLTIGALS